MIKASRFTCCAFVCALTISTVVSAAEWGTITGKFVIDGSVPKAGTLTVNKDKEFCGTDVIDDSLLVSAEGGIANVGIWLNIGRGDKAPEPHPEVLAKSKEPYIIDNKNCVYVPHISLISPGQVVKFKNSDPIAHNFKVEGFSNSAFNTLVPAGAEYEHKFESEESYPMNAACSIHAWMSAKIIVKESPYMTVSKEDGTFTIENLPVGEWEFKFWHEKPGNIKSVNIDGKKESDRKGLYEFEVKEGKNDLGVIKISADTFED